MAATIPTCDGKIAGRPPDRRPGHCGHRVRPGPSRLPLRAAAPALTDPDHPAFGPDGTAREESRAQWRGD